MVLSDSAPDVSIIIPTFRREEQLREALHSVLALQDLRFEVFVVDDSPEGGARAVVEAIGDPRITYQQRAIPTGGRPAVIRNAAARTARGRVLYFLDDDDRAIAANLSQACTALMASSAGVLVSTPRPFGANPQRIQEEIHYFAQATAFLRRPRSKLTLTARLLFAASPLVCSTCVIKAATFAAVGGFDEAIALYEDVEFYQRAIRAAGFVFQAAPILERRVGDASLISLGSTDKVAQSYRMAHAKYRAQHGLAEFWALKIWSKLLNRITPAQLG
jgi:glycosyltransferase involved in cell wall biosynthesis